MEEVKNYISTRYQRYLDYADYHASLAGLDQQGPDVLHEVIISILEKDPKMIKQLYDRTKKGLRELDFYILRMIKLNCHSMTSPYRFRYKFPVEDGNITPADLQDQEDIETIEQSTREEMICSRFEIIREILNDLTFSDREKEIFRWKFFHENTWKDWQGKESKEHLKDTYKAIMQAIIYRIEMRKLSYTAHVITSRHRMDEIILEYRRSPFPAAYMVSRRYIKAERVYRQYNKKLEIITGKSQEPCLESGPLAAPNIV